MTESSVVTAARAAIDAGEFGRALDLLSGDDPASQSAEALELRAQAAYGHGEFELAVAAWESLYTVQSGAGDAAEAARAAAMIAMYLMMDTGLMAPVRGWLRRAERLVADRQDAPAHAIIAMTRTYERFMCGDMDAARDQSALAIELGERLDVTPAVVIGRVAAARVRIFDGQVEEGLELLDEIGTLLMSGEVDPLTTGMMYCELICAAQGLSLFDMASEWTEVMEHWRHGAAFGGINGRCRVHRAEILRVTGPCDEAEAEALGACDELRPWMRREFGWPLVELGNIRLRKGDLAGAEEAFVAAYEHAWSPQPGMALLRLEQGDIAAAAALIADAVAHPFDIPSKERPPFGDLRLAPLLDAQVMIAAAAGDVAVAREAASDLRRIAASYPSRALAAAAQLATGRAALVAGDLDGAIAACSSSAAGWADVSAPFDGAVARTVLADALERAGHAERARLERRAAMTAFVTFGAVRWAERLRGELEGVQSRAAAPVATAMFRREGGTRTVCFEGRTVNLGDLKGLRYVERLLAEPGREFHVLDLVAVEQGTLPTATRSEASSSRRGDAALPVLDEQARAAYRRRLAEVDDDIEEARRLNDPGRLELAERDRGYLMNELSHAIGLGGRERMVGGTAERARTAVARSLRYALQRLAEHDADLAGHLRHAIRTGTYCAYVPDPRAPIRWET